MPPTQTASQPAFGSTNAIVPGGGADVNPFAPTPSSNSNNALIVTSGPGRAVTADNTAKLASMTQTGAPQGGTSTTQNGADTSSKTNSGNGMYQYRTADGRTVNYGDPSSNRDALAGSTFLMGPTGTEKDPLGGTTAAPGGASPDGSVHDSAVSNIADPVLAAQYKSVLQGVDKEISQAQSNIDSISQRSVNDPATQAIVAAIKQKWDLKIQAMKDKNQMVLGRASTSVAAFGGLGQMSQNFLSDEETKAQDRVNTLQNQEDSAILAAQVAAQTQNYKDLNTAMDQYDKANAAKLSALNTLLSEGNKQVAAAQAQARIDAQDKKNELSADVEKSTKIAAGVAQNIEAAGLKDPNDIMTYIKGLASTYGIANPDMLYSQVVAQQRLNAKSDLAAKNTEDQMNARDQNLTLATKRLAIAAEKTAQPKPVSVSEKKDNFNAGVVQLQGKRTSAGVPYYYVPAQNNPTGQSYLTSDGFKTLVAAAKVDGISRMNFIKDNPEKLNPDDLTGYGLTDKEKAVIASSN